MPTLLEIAARVEAAVEAYNAVRDSADSEDWRAKFRREMVSIHLHGV